MVAIISIVACGGGGGGAAPGTTQLPPPAGDANPGGIWVGTLENEDVTFEELTGITTSDGQFRLISLDTFGPDTFGQYVGLATVDGSSVSGNGRLGHAAFKCHQPGGIAKNPCDREVTARAH